MLPKIAPVRYLTIMAIKRSLKNQLFLIKHNTGTKLAFLFGCILLLSSLVIYAVERSSNDRYQSIFDSIWWTIVTISTVGYGDISPTTTTGKILAIFIIFLGVAMMGTITGRIATSLMERQMKEEKGLLSYEGLKGHFIICGWKREMHLVIQRILDNDNLLYPSEIILLNQASSEEINQIRSDPLLKGLKYVHGDFIEETDLVRAGIRNAKRVLILADYHSEGDIQQIDSRTVMAVMTVKNLNKKAFVCAELLDTKYAKYLKLSHCDEILLSREFSRRMLASASLSDGTSHVIMALLSKSCDCNITTVKLPDSSTDLTFGAIKQQYGENGKNLIIGLLENTGNIISRKSEALRETQKNPDIAQILSGLQSIKSLEANSPLINPPDNYVIKKFTRAIMIKGSTKIQDHNT